LIVLPTTACDEIIDFIVAGKSSEQIDAFRPSEQTQTRISSLLDLAKGDSLNQAERAELDDFLQLEHLIMAKARARRQPMR
jgi:hypothetical protein